MPTCAEFKFGVIDQYLSIRDQMDTQQSPIYTDLDHQVPQVVDERTLAQPPVSMKSEYPNFLDMDMIQPFSGAHPVTCATTTTGTTVTSSGYISNSYNYDSQPGVKCYVAEAAGSGCTIIEGSPIPGDSHVPVATSPDSHSYTPDLFDLDSHSSTFYDDFSAKKPIKTEPYISSNCQLDGPESWIIQQIRQEIEYDCQNLVCSNDPREWSEEEVQNWVKYTNRKHRYPDDCSCYFNVRGDIFCQMVEDDFRWRSKVSGSFLFQQLEVWKMACTLNSNALPCPDPSTSPAPSTGSTCSTMSSSSSGATYPSDSMDDEVFSHSQFKASVNPAHRASPAAPREHAGPRQPKQTIHLWQFLRELLDDPESYHGCIKWTDRARGVFKIEDSSKVARLWGRRKNRPAMNYDKLSRSVRQYYKKGIIKKTEQSKRLVYQFCQPYL